MKKGFTLVELVGVVVLLGVIGLLITPLVDKQVKEAKEKMYQEQIDSIKSSAALFITNDIKPKDGESIKITLSQLKLAGLVDIDIENPIEKELFPNDMEIIIKNTSGIITYDVENNSNNITKFDELPSLELNGKTVEYVSLKDTWTDPGAMAKYQNSNLQVTVTGLVNTSKPGSYYLYYTAYNNAGTNKIIRTVIVKDLTAPVISIPTTPLVVSLSAVPTYDFKSDITVTDNSGLAPTVTVSHNIVRTGTYSIEYKAVDSSGNVATKTRQIIVN